MDNHVALQIKFTHEIKKLLSKTHLIHRDLHFHTNF